MNPRLKYLAGSALALSLATGTAVLSNDRSTDTATPALAGTAAGMHFTDEHGNARVPTADERAALAAAFQQDLADLTRGKRIPAGKQAARGGAVSAVVGVDKIRFLTVTVDEQGTATFDHATPDENGHIETDTANQWPEM
jgi:hypothetical protein